VRRPHLAHPQRGQGAWHPHRGRARRSHRRVCRRRRGAPVGPARRGRRHRRPGITNTITALKNAQLAQSPLLLLGGAAPTALQGRGALQDINQRPLVEPHVKRFFKITRVRDLGPAVADALALARSGVPGPVFVECPVDLLYDEANIRQWYADAAGKGTGLADRALRWYLQRHVKRMFDGSQQATAPAVQTVTLPQASEASVRAAAAALAQAQRPLAVIGSQAVVNAAEVTRLADAVTRLGIPVYLSGMARGLLGREHPLQMRHQRRNALREADCVLLAGVPCDFRLDYGKHVRRSAKLIAANRSAKDARLNRRPDVTALGDAGQFLQALAAAAPAADRSTWLATLRGVTRPEKPRSTSRPPHAVSTSTPSPCFARWSRRPATTPCSWPTVATSWPRPAMCCTRAAR
jgi:thiamine pyrophosphate-dependent acetolactate synthase large subunit-like protein